MSIALSDREVLKPKYIIGRDFTFDQETHIYRDMAKRVIPGNTTLLKTYHLISHDGIPAARLDYKSKLGTAVHYACHLLNENNLDESSLDACDESLKRFCPGEHKSIKGYINAYRRFCEVTGFEARFSELPLWSKKFGFCTTLDLQGPFNFKNRERESILEIKTVWEMQYSNQPQTAAQKIAFEENFPGIKIESRFGLQLKDDGTFDTPEYKDPRDRQVFLACLEIQRAREENGLIKQEKPR